MGYPLRWNQTNVVYEVTLETIQGRYLLRPNREVRDLVLGVLSLALARYHAIRLYAFVFTRDRATLLLSSADEQQLSRFMAYVAGGISRRLGRLLDWSGKLWNARYLSVPVLDEEALTERLRFVLSQGVAEGLIESPKDWPGATCVPALLGDMKLEGVWVNRDREAALRAAGLDPPPSAYVQPYRVDLARLPPWADLPAKELVARHAAMIESIEYEYLVTRNGDVVGPLELQRQDPFFRPSERKLFRRFALLCHSTCAGLGDAFRAAYRGFCAAFRAAATAFIPPARMPNPLVAGFPAGCNPRPDLRVPLRPEERPPAWCQVSAPAGDPDLEATIADEEHTDPGDEPPTVRWSKPARPRASPTPGSRPAPANVALAPRARRDAAMHTRAMDLARSPPAQESV